MTIAKPLTTYNELAEALTALTSNNHFSDPSQFEWRRIERKIQQLKSVEPAEGWTMLAVLNSTSGNKEEVLKCTAEAFHYQVSDSDILNIISAHLNVGEFSEALNLFVKYCRPERGLFTSCTNFVGTLGAHRTFRELQEKADLMGISIKEDLSVYRAAANLMERTGLQDKDIAKHMDIAGKILVSHRLHGSYKTNAIDDSEDYVGITNAIGVALSSEEIFSLNMELARAETENNLVQNPIFDVVFTSIDTPPISVKFAH